MRTDRLFLLFLFLLVFYKSFGQDVQLTKPILEFDGDQLLIKYDFIDARPSDQFYVWIEMEKKNGDQIKMKSVSGDVGNKIKSGTNKKIRWIPENDSVLLNEEVFVRVKAEKYIKSFNRGSMILLSTVFPGWGQAKISKGKAWWLTGIASYGALAGGLIVHLNYVNTYSSYNSELDPVKRANLLSLSQKQYSLSNALVISGAALWAANIVWVALTPMKYQPLQSVKISLQQSGGFTNKFPLLALSYNF